MALNKNKQKAPLLSVCSAPHFQGCPNTAILARQRAGQSKNTASSITVFAVAGSHTDPPTSLAVHRHLPSTPGGSAGAEQAQVPPLSGALMCTLNVTVCELLRRNPSSSDINRFREHWTQKSRRRKSPAHRKYCHTQNCSE